MSDRSPVCFEIRIGFFHTGRGEGEGSGEGKCERRIGAKPFIFPCFQLWAFIYKSWKMMVCIWNFFLHQNFLHYTFLYFNLSFPHDHHWTKFLCMVVKLPEVNFFLQKSASDIFPYSRNIQISKIHATLSPRENTLIIIKLENFKLLRPNL